MGRPRPAAQRGAPVAPQRWRVPYPTISRVLQPILREEWDVLVSIGSLNQVRAALGVGYVPPPQEKKS